MEQRTTTTRARSSYDDVTNETHEQELGWNPDEDTNVQEKDMGAVKGTNLKDLCNLVGGMSAGERVKVLSSDGWNRWFAYKNVYGYSSREGPIGISWYKDGTYPDSGYTDGMRMIWFADTSNNPWGCHAFGNFDWHEAAAPEYWYYYQSGTEKYPTTTGISGQYVNRIFIYSNQAPPASINVTSPNGGESWVRGSNHAITWTSTGNVGSYVKMEVAEGWCSSADRYQPVTPNDGSYSLDHFPRTSDRD